MISNKTKFRPVYGTQDAILAAPKVPGYFYIASDTGKVFVDVDTNTRIAAGGGGGVSIYYGDQAEVPQDADGLGFYVINQDAITEEGVHLTVDDLIINSDGAFYKIFKVDDDAGTYICTRIAISGSGGGGGGVGPQADLVVSIDSETLTSSQTLIHGKDHYVTVTATSITDPYVTLVFDFTGADGYSESRTLRQVESGEPAQLNLNFLPVNSSITMIVTATADNSTMTTSPFKRLTGLRVVEMGISKVSADEYMPAINTGESYRLSLNFEPTGPKNVANFTEQLHVYIDNVENYDLSRQINPDEFGKSRSVTIPHQSHGVHKIDLSVSTTVNGNTLESDKISFEAAWVDPEEDTPIIWIGNYDKVVINYENATIPFMVYNPEDVQNQRKSSVILFKDGKQISELEVAYSTSEWKYWDISAIYTVGKNRLSIQCGLASKNIEVEVTTEGSRDLGLEDEYSLMMNFSAAGRSSSELLSTRNKWISETDSRTTEALLEGFNWANNGWVSPSPDSADYKNGSYLSIANGSKVTIPMPTIILNQGKQRNYSFEVRFRVKNVQKYSTLVSTIPTYFYKDKQGIEHKGPTDGLTMKQIEELGYEVLFDEYGTQWMNDNKTIQETNITSGVICKWLNANGEGFVIGTQESFFQSPEKLVSVRYKEDEVINLSFIISADDSLVYIYLNGILSGATTLPSLTSAAPAFSITNDLVFNSTYCDLDLYRIRLYETGLTMPQVIHNYLSDLHDIAKYDQNQLTLATNDYVLSYNKLVQYNEEHPNEVTMPYATWEITQNDDKGRETLPYYKGDKRKVTVNFVNTPLDAAYDKGEINDWYYYTHCPSFISTAVEIDVQGTSSQGYPRRNYKLKHKKAKKWQFTHGPLAGQSLTKKWYFDKTTHEAIDPSICDIDILVPPIDPKGDDESQEVYDARLAAYKDAVSAAEADLKSRYDVLTTNFHMDNEAIGTNKFTWKIDYMESSGSYNTGFANLMGNQEHPLYMKHPLEDQGFDAGTMRTSVYGFPLLVFHKYADPAQNPTESGQEYEYIGRYNINLDKGSNEYYGFEDKNKNVALNKSIKDIAESWELSDNQGTWCSWKFPTAEARETGFGTLQDGYDDRLEMMQHFEYRYSKYGDQLDAIGAKGKYDGTTSNQSIIDQIGTTNAQKSHYVRKTYYNLERLFYWLDSTDTTAVNSEDLQDIIIREPILDPDTGDVTIQKTVLESVTYKTSQSYDGIDGATSTPASGGGYTTVFTKDSVGYRKAKFRNEFDLHLDKHYCCVYFITTELLLCYDSRGKNMMMSTWGPHEVGGEYIWYPIFYDIDTQLGLNNSGAYLWDYDADVTKDGLFSTPGSVLWTNLYDVFYEDIVNTYRILRGLAVDETTKKITKSLTYANITGAYECNGDTFNSYAMRGLRPVIAIGLDEYYKYFATTKASKVGYYDTSGTLVQEGSPSYAYCCQGDKILNTELLLRNRLNYIDSWWIAGDYQIEQVKGSSTQMRVSGNRYSETSDKYFDLPQAQIDSDPALAAVHAQSRAYPQPGQYDSIVPGYDSIPGYKLKPFLKQYVFYYTDEQPGSNVKYNDTAAEQNGVWTPVPSDKLASYKIEKNSPNSQLCYIPGMNYLSSMGDLSVSYIDEFFLKSGLRLLDLILGSDLPNYYNSLIVPDKFGIWDSLSDINYEKPEESKHKPLLKKVVLTGLTAFNANLDLSASFKLEEFRALRTPLSTVTFADGAPLHTVHLPSTVSSLALIESTDLTKILTTTPVIGTWDDDTWTWTPADPATYRGLYIEGVTDVNPDAFGSGHAITSVTIQGGKLKYKSYTLLKNLVDLKEGATRNNLLKANLTGLDWTPYTIVPYGEAQDNRVTYYQLTDHNTYEVYTGNDQNEWNNLTLNEKLYTYDENAEMSTITDLSLLDIFRRDFLNAPNTAAQQYTNTSGNSAKTVPALTGHLFVNNTPETAIDEVRISKSPTGSYNPNDPTYGDLWPDLIIQARYVNEAYITKYVQILESGKENLLDINRYNKTVEHPSITQQDFNKKAAKLNYEFRGWTTDPTILDAEHSYSVQSDLVDSLIMDGKILDTPEKVAALTFDENNDTYILYAVFSITSFGIHFMDPQDQSEEYGSYLAPYGTYLYEPELYCATDESNIMDTERYKFIGWSKVVDAKTNNLYQDQSSANRAKLIDLTTIISQNEDQYFYAVYVKEDCLTTVTDLKYFDFAYAAIGFEDNVNSSKNVGKSYFVSGKSGYNLKGKITLPATYNDGTHGDAPIVGINTRGFNFETGKDITHIYWYGDTSNFRIIRNYAFQSIQGQSKLKYFQMPTSIRIIGSNAFANCSELQWIDFSQTELQQVDSNGFFGAFRATNENTHLYFPPTLSKIGESGFAQIFQNTITEDVFGGTELTLEFGTNDGIEGCSAMASFSTNAISMTDQAPVGTVIGHFKTEQEAMTFVNGIISYCRLRGWAAETTYDTVNFQLLYPQ